MKIKTTDYNGVADIVRPHWEAIEQIITNTSLRTKSSDQRGIQGSVIFDPVGTNQALKTSFVQQGWACGVAIPGEYNFLGTDVDFVKDNIIMEVQFSNYPFLLNNVVRTHLFSRQEVNFLGNTPRALIIITKCKIFPASNSTLYYEQARNQLNVLASPEVFNLPIRLVGLSEDEDSVVSCIHTSYENARYSRIVANERQVQCRIRSNGARARLEFV
jgi:hypothetical protein